MDNLIRVYDNVIDSEYCFELMDKFENNEQLHQKFDDRGMIFTQINIQKVGWLHDVNGTVIEVDETIGKLNAYSKFCQATLTGDKPYGIIDGGVAFNTSTTHGDGSYQVTIVKDSFGTQRGIYICLDGSDPDIEVKEDDDSYL